MIRVPRGDYSAVIEASLALIPARIAVMLTNDWFCGTDPVFAGLHKYVDASFGRSYSKIEHVAYPANQRHMPRAQRRTTVVMPVPDVSVDYTVHELGHVLHEALRFKPRPTAVSWYAATNHHEAFAEAFTSWLIPGYAEHPDKQTVHLLESLAAA